MKIWGPQFNPIYAIENPSRPSGRYYVFKLLCQRHPLGTKQHITFTYLNSP